MNTIDLLLERCGYIKCQIEMSEYIRERTHELGAEMTNLRKEISACESLLSKQELITKLSALDGEREGLRRVWRHISSVPFSNSNSRQLPS